MGLLPNTLATTRDSGANSTNNVPAATPTRVLNTRGRGMPTVNTDARATKVSPALAARGPTVLPEVMFLLVKVLNLVGNALVVDVVTTKRDYALAIPVTQDIGAKAKAPSRKCSDTEPFCCLATFPVIIKRKKKS